MKITVAATSSDAKQLKSAFKSRFGFSLNARKGTGSQRGTLLLSVPRFSTTKATDKELSNIGRWLEDRGYICSYDFKLEGFLSRQNAYICWNGGASLTVRKRAQDTEMNYPADNSSAEECSAPNIELTGPPADKPVLTLPTGVTSLCQFRRNRDKRPKLLRLKINGRGEDTQYFSDTPCLDLETAIQESRLWSSVDCRITVINLAGELVSVLRE